MSRQRQQILAALRRHWGYDSFLPLQEHAMAFVMRGLETVVVLPTGGGKSLCFQAPAVVLPGTALVVSPLISLMKDQVDALTECGVAAARLDSSLSPAQRQAALQALRAGTLDLVYVSPERLASPEFVALLQTVELSFIAVDEAHCVSLWGHDFRPEYRALGALRQALPGVPLHAYTATATEPVRTDIAAQLRLTHPRFLVGSFDRPNLTYRVQRRQDVVAQVTAILDRHANSSGIVYCIRRAEVDELAERLVELGYRALPYHAGMTDEARKHNQDAFLHEQADVIVATVAFGMGIDKSNVRFVVHAGMPKSLEHYQQESGRAGRDGLEAECTLLFAPGDRVVWSRILNDSEPATRQAGLAKLNDMTNYCTGVTCRHAALVRYFGQELETDNCEACDVCLGHLDCLADAEPVAQALVRGVLELRERFGGDYVSRVLTGSAEQRLLANGHDSLGSYGALSKYSQRQVRDWLEQLVAQGYLVKQGEYSLVQVTPEGHDLLTEGGQPRLLKPAERKPRRLRQAKRATESWEGVEVGLFELLRAQRRQLAADRGVPAFVVFSDATLRDLARRKPTTLAEFLLAFGVGQMKCAQYGESFTALIRQYLEGQGGDPEAQ